MSAGAIPQNSTRKKTSGSAQHILHVLAFAFADARGVVCVCVCVQVRIGISCATQFSGNLSYTNTARANSGNNLLVGPLLPQHTTDTDWPAPGRPGTKIQLSRRPYT